MAASSAVGGAPRPLAGAGVLGALLRGPSPRQRFIPFAAVRSLSPREFVRVLAQELQVAGVVVGQNYRFGYKVLPWRCSPLPFAQGAMRTLATCLIE